MILSVNHIVTRQRYVVQMYEHSTDLTNGYTNLLSKNTFYWDLTIGYDFELLVEIYGYTYGSKLALSVPNSDR